MFLPCMGSCIGWISIPVGNTGLPALPLLPPPPPSSLPPSQVSDTLQREAKVEHVATSRQGSHSACPPTFLGTCTPFLQCQTVPTPRMLILICSPCLGSASKIQDCLRKNGMDSHPSPVLSFNSTKPCNNYDCNIFYYPLIPRRLPSSGWWPGLSYLCVVHLLAGLKQWNISRHEVFSGYKTPICTECCNLSPQ